MDGCTLSKPKVPGGNRSTFKKSDFIFSCKIVCLDEEIDRTNFTEGVTGPLLDKNAFHENHS